MTKKRAIEKERERGKGERGERGMEKKREK